MRHWQDMNRCLPKEELACRLGLALDGPCSLALEVHTGVLALNGVGSADLGGKMYAASLRPAARM